MPIGWKVSQVTFALLALLFPLVATAAQFTKDLNHGRCGEAGGNDFYGGEVCVIWDSGREQANARAGDARRESERDRGRAELAQEMSNLVQLERARVLDEVDRNPESRSTFLEQPYAPSSKLPAELKEYLARVFKTKGDLVEQGPKVADNLQGQSQRFAERAREELQSAEKAAKAAAGFGKNATTSAQRGKKMHSVEGSATVKSQQRSGEVPTGSTISSRKEFQGGASRIPTALQNRSASAETSAIGARENVNGAGSAPASELEAIRALYSGGGGASLDFFPVDSKVESAKGNSGAEKALDSLNALGVMGVGGEENKLDAFVQEIDQVGKLIESERRADPEADRADRSLFQVVSHQYRKRFKMFAGQPEAF